VEVLQGPYQRFLKRILGLMMVAEDTAEKLEQRHFVALKDVGQRGLVPGAKARDQFRVRVFGHALVPVSYPYGCAVMRHYWVPPMRGSVAFTCHSSLAPPATWRAPRSASWARAPGSTPLNAATAAAPRPASSPRPLSPAASCPGRTGRSEPF